MSGDDPVAVVRDFLALTGPRRDDLRGAKWPRGRPGGSVREPAASRDAAPRPPIAPALLLRRDPLPAGLPSQAARALFSAMPAGARLSLALRYAIAPLRREAGQPGVGHRAVASAAALFPVDVFVIAPDGSLPTTYRCCADAAALLCDDRVRLRVPPADPGALTLVLVARLARCIEPYGDLAPCLALIEAGMVEAQLSLMLGLAGWPAELRQVTASGVVDTDLHWSDLPVSVMTVAGAGTALATLDRGATPVGCEPDHASAEPFDRVRRLLAAIAAPVVAAMPPARATRATHSTRWLAPRCLARAAERRSSGSAGGHAQRRGVGAAAVEAMLRDVATLAAMLPSGGASRPVTTVAARSGDDDAVRSFAFEPGDAVAFRPVHRIPGDAEPILPDGAVLLVTLGYDHVAALAAEGAGAYATAHRSVGRVAQCFCLAAAAHGLVARPLRSFVPAAADARMPLAADAVLQIVVGVDVAPTLSVVAEPAR